MNSRERVIAAINHREPDRVPLDLGSTHEDGISASTLTKLRKALGLEDRKVKLIHPFQMLGAVEDDVKAAIGADCAGLWGSSSCFGYRQDNWKPWTLQDGTEVLVGGGFETTEDEEGNIYVYPQGDKTVPPCAKLPKGGYYFDQLDRQGELDEDDMDGRRDYAEQFKVYSEEELKFIQERAIDLYENTEYAIIGNFSLASFGDLGGPLPAYHMKHTPGIRRAEEWMMAHLLYPEYVEDVYALQTEVCLESLKLLKEAVGDRIQILRVSSTDFGTQKGEFISPDMFREFYKPNYIKINRWIHENTNWKIMFHSCGSIVNLLDDFVEMGVDILNPVQCSAVGMDPKFLKDTYGDKLVFWGGAVDTQKTLQFGTPEEVRAEVLERLEIFSKGGGFVCNQVHNIQTNTPVENILAFYDALTEFNSRKAK